VRRDGVLARREVLVTALPAPAHVAWRYALVGLWLHLVAIAWIAPVIGDDWGPAIAIARGEAIDHALAHPRLTDLAHLAIVGSKVVHVVVSPLVVLALIAGLVAIALGRVPDVRKPDDARAMVIVSTLLWLAAPRSGLVVSYRSLLAIEVYGLCAAVWFAMPYVLGKTPFGRLGPVARAAAMAALGVAVGMTSRPVATVAATGLVIAVAVSRTRVVWKWAGVAGIAIGAVATWIVGTPIDWEDIASRGASNLDLFNRLFFFPVYIAFATVVLAAFHVVRHPITAGAGPTRRIPAVVAIALAASIGSGALVLLVPKLTTVRMFAPAAAIVVACAAVILAIVPIDRAIRRVMIGLVIAAQLGMVISSAVLLVPAWQRHADRIEALEAAAPGTTAVVPPYSRHKQNQWFFGEDFLRSNVRDRVATEIYGLRAIVLEPALGTQEPAAELGLRADAPVGTATPPWYSADLATARAQFGRVLAGTDGARLVVTAVAVPDRSDPIVAATIDRGRLVHARLAQPRIDRDGRLRLRVSGIDPTVVWALALDRVEDRVALPREDDTYVLIPGRRTVYAIVACTPDRCLLADLVYLV
jgi:hypothetical protein